MALTDGAGRLSLEWLRKRAGQPHDWPNAPTKRSRAAVHAQFRRLYGEGGLTRGTSTFQHLIEATGYSRSHILRARQALNQQWRRLTSRGPWLVTEDQAEAVIQWLRGDHWSKAKRLDSCLWCGTDNAPMRALGLCQRDYLRYRRVCRSLKLPTSPRAQLEFVMAIGGPLDMIDLVERGLALDVDQLAEIGTVAE